MAVESRTFARSVGERWSVGSAAHCDFIAMSLFADFVNDVTNSGEETHPPTPAMLGCDLLEDLLTDVHF